MQTYNRALDYAALAMQSLHKGDGVMAARLLAKAVAEPDVKAAIATIEASNKQAFELTANKAAQEAKLAASKKSASRLTASDDGSEDSDFPLDNDVGDDVGADDMDADDSDDVTAEFGEDDDPLADLADEEGEDDVAEDTPGVAMAKVLSSMTRRVGTPPAKTTAKAAAKPAAKK